MIARGKEAVRCCSLQRMLLTLLLPPALRCRALTPACLLPALPCRPRPISPAHWLTCYSPPLPAPPLTVPLLQSHLPLLTYSQRRRDLAVLWP